MAAERSRAMEELKKEVMSLRQQGKDGQAEHMNMIGEVIHAVQVETMGHEGMEGMKHRLESVCSSVEQRAVNVDGRINHVDDRINEMEKRIMERINHLESQDKVGTSGSQSWRTRVWKT